MHCHILTKCNIKQCTKICHHIEKTWLGTSIAVMIQRRLTFWLVFVEQSNNKMFSVHSTNSLTQILSRRLPFFRKENEKNLRNFDFHEKVYQVTQAELRKRHQIAYLLPEVKRKITELRFYFCNPLDQCFCRQGFHPDLNSLKSSLKTPAFR